MIVATAIEGIVCFMVLMLVVDMANEIVSGFNRFQFWRRSGSRKMSEPAVVRNSVDVVS